MSKVFRQSNIELLRVLAIMGVIVLHYNNPIIGKGIVYAEEGGLNFYILYFLESLFVCGVNLFMLISGFFMCEGRSRSLWKPIELIVQVIIFKELVYFAHVVLGHTAFSIKTCLTTMVPSNYFVILYCVVYLLSPFLNLLIEKLTDVSLKTMLVLAICLFSIYPTLVDVLSEMRGTEFTGLSTIGMYGSQWGYSSINFLLMYLVGAYLKKGKSAILSWSNAKLLVSLALCIALMMLWARVNDRTGFFTERSAWEYCNPLVVFEAVIVFAVFFKFDIGVIPVINKLAEGVFSVFLLHHFFIPYLSIEKYVNATAFMMLAHILFSMIALYVICWCVHVVYHLIMDPLFKKIETVVKLPLVTADAK